MDIDIFSIVAELGISAVALFMFYKILERTQRDHREDRTRDNELWREETKTARDKTDEVIKELTNVIRTNYSSTQK